ncbi:helix-turn-helix transcriptional regulator [Candidatus Poriferisodalis sp.]|uniref:helix-turn-helix transcriptional regulator n=1 Tax=Candidatus Poriferisodalis sp. TaxID=3101277 RepID=UPI003B011731
MSTTIVAAEVLPPGEYLTEELAARGWTVSQLAERMGQPKLVVLDILETRMVITPELAEAISAALGTSAQMWLNLEEAYRSRTPTQGG